MCVNGAAARLVHTGDHVIIISYAQMTLDEARCHRPVIVLLDRTNAICDPPTVDRVPGGGTQ